MERMVQRALIAEEWEGDVPEGTSDVLQEHFRSMWPFVRAKGRGNYFACTEGRCPCLKNCGLPCVHVNFERMAQNHSLLPNSEDISGMYYQYSRPEFESAGFRSVGNVYHKAHGANVRWTQVTGRLETVAASTPRGSQAREAIDELFDRLEDIGLTGYPGRRVRRPALRADLPGQPRRRARRNCSFYHVQGHYKSTYPQQLLIPTATQWATT